MCQLITKRGVCRASADVGWLSDQLNELTLWNDFRGLTEQRESLTPRNCVHVVLWTNLDFFFILLDLMATVDHPHGTIFQDRNRAPMLMRWKATVAYLILHPHTFIYHIISWIICPSTASLEQKVCDSWCSSAHLILHESAVLCREQKALSYETLTLKDLIKFVEIRNGPALVTLLCNKCWELHERNTLQG